jgi:predicted nucleic acid-binding protein
MIIADTNVWIAYLEGGSGPDVAAFEVALADQVLRMAPVVIAELLSDPALSEEIESQLASIPVLDLLPGFWLRAGKLRSRLLYDGMRPKLADTLIAQTCLDYEAVLLTRDVGFRSYGPYGLKLF